jgi:RimJ/RimL family protein N-acetyltransferase
MIELQPFTKADISILIGWIGSPESLLQWGGPAFTWPLDEDQVERQLFPPVGDEPHFLAFKGVDTQSQLVVGHVELAGINRENRSARIARVLVGPEYLRGRGTGTQIMQAILNIGFAQLGLHRIELGVFVFNESAIACYEKVGFKKEGLLRDSHRVGEEYWSSYLMSTLEHEWRTSTTTSESE